LKGIRYCNQPNTALCFPSPRSDTIWTGLVCHWESPEKPDETEIEWDTSASTYADDVNLLGDNIDTIKKNT
jgi:hypothetical protein